MMSVYVDELKRQQRHWRYGKSCHLFADTVSELHTFAASIGLKREWFQDTRHPHYDLTASKRRQAVREGAIEISARDYIKIKRSARWIDMM